MNVKGWSAGALSVLLAVTALAGCSKEEGKGGADSSSSPAPSVSNETSTSSVDEQPGTVYYEIFVRSFYDSDGNGIGDFRGLTQKLDYLNDGDPNTTTDLGVEGIWLMPINPSPSYHGYDVTDYYGINPEYGTMEDFSTFLAEAHKRGIKVIMDLVVNHASAKHPWFQAAAADVSSPYRSWFRWADDSANLTEASATGNSKAWHPTSTGSYMGGFWDQMPDLNFDNPEVRAEMNKIGQYWLKEGLDGFRLDAAKHIFEDVLSDKGKKEVTERNLDWWREFRAALEEVKPDVYLVGEVWENSPVSVAPYLEVFDSCFNFGTAINLLKIAQSESDASLASNMERIYGLYEKSSQGRFIDAPFLSNHDQDRVMSVLKGNTDHAKMAASMLLTLPGSPFLYYGEEIGMLGQKPDEYIREPMLWYKEGKAEQGTTSWIPSKYNRHAPVSVEDALAEPESLLKTYQMLLRWRGESPSLRNGGIRSADYDQQGIVAYHRMTEKDRVLVIHNISGKEVVLPLVENDQEQYRKILQQSKPAIKLDKKTVILPAYSTVILH